MRKFWTCSLLMIVSAFVMAGTPWGTVTYEGVATPVDLTKVNSSGEAVLTDADLDPTKVPVKIKFKSGTIALGEIALTLTEKQQVLEFVAGDEGTTLQASENASLFSLKLSDTLSLSDGSACKWRFKGLAFKGVTLASTPELYDGGAISCEHGSLELVDCSFEDFTMRFSGGAVSARLMDGDVTVTNCVFRNNRTRPVNGYGGAVYASASRQGVVLDVVDSSFVGNAAENGGGICTMPVVDDDEVAIAVKVRGGAVFAQNAAVYGGGAIFANGDVTLAETNTLFQENSAGSAGGAICVTGVSGKYSSSVLTITAGVCFSGNRASTNLMWTAGGAVAVLPLGYRMNVTGAVFTNNYACTKDPMPNGKPSLGGAIYLAEGVDGTFSRTAFLENDVRAGDTIWCYGGAVSAANAKMAFDTCIFDCGLNVNAKSYGDALDFCCVTGSLKNCTFRRGKTEAVSTYNGSLDVLNCVIVGNGLVDGNHDLYLDGTTCVTMTNSAYGTYVKASGVKLLEAFNLTNRTPSSVYKGDSLLLDDSGFNPVAGLGLKQAVKDFVGVTYGSKAWGYSMGAYETPTLRLLVKLDGTKTYDTTTTSNGCTWTWSLYTNVVSDVEALWDDLGAPEDAFTITSWAFGSPSVGWYCSTNKAPRTIAATLQGKTDRIEWYRAVLDFLYTGTIEQESDVVVLFDPAEYAWTGSEIKPGASGVGTVLVSNTVTHVVIPDSQYVVSWDDNVDPTASAELIVTSRAGGDYSFCITNRFFITAYLTDYYLDDVLSSPVSTNGTLSGSNVVAAISVPSGYCLDYQNSTTNATAYRYGQGGSGNPKITTLIVRYAKDSNGDKVPDKYQVKVLFATVNGWWNGKSNGYDQYVWVTLTNATRSAKGVNGEGTWDTSGSCLLTAGIVPAVGEQPFEGWAYESATAGTWNTQPVGTVIQAGSFPIFFYSPARVTLPNPNPGTRPSERMNALISVEEVTLKNVLNISDFELTDDGLLSGTIMAQVQNVASSTVVREMELANAQLEVLGVSNLGDDWKVVATVKTDENGTWAVTRVHRDLADRVVVQSADGSLQMRDDSQPRYFKLRLVSGN